jgi:hypothetical protein
MAIGNTGKGCSNCIEKRKVAYSTGIISNPHYSILDDT